MKVKICTRCHKENTSRKFKLCAKCRQYMIENNKKYDTKAYYLAARRTKPDAAIKKTLAEFGNRLSVAMLSPGIYAIHVATYSSVRIKEVLERGGYVVKIDADVMIVRHYPTISEKMP